MSRRKKLLSRIQDNPQNVRFEDICKLAEAFGFEYKGGKGSHEVYTKKGVIEILNLQNVKGFAKPYQVKQFLKMIEDYNLKLEEE